MYPVSTEQLRIQWSPPIQPNGNVTHYEVTATWEQVDPNFLQQRNYCTERKLYLYYNYYI